MSIIPDRIAKLNNAELRQELMRIGITPAPLTPTTRKLYQKKLALSLCPTYSNDNSDDRPKTQSLSKKNDTGVQVVKSFQQSDKAKTDEEFQVGDNYEKKHSSRSNPCYYVVILQLEDDEVSSKICNNKADAMNLLHHKKDSRFQQFSSMSKAQEFIQKQKIYFETSKTRNVSKSEKANDFPAPRQVDLTRLMSAIEANDQVQCDELIWKNPRCLVSAADGPVPLKASMRYNALHIAARSNHPGMIPHFLATLENPTFHDLMYSNCTSESANDRESRTAHIVDLYLNTPEKGCFDTPLHIACKFGYADVVAELINHPLCDKTIRNKEGKTPADVVCSRCKESGGDNLKEEILCMLDDHYYVPLYRYLDCTLPPTIGQPWNPSMPLKENGVSLATSDPYRVISAVAGPMSLMEAQKLYHSWASPRRKDAQGRHYVDIRLRDTDRGEERVGREVSHHAGHQWCEYWDFLQTFSDFSTEEGITLLEEFFRQRENIKRAALPSNDESICDVSRQLSLMRLTSPIRISDDSSLTPSRHKSFRTPIAENVCSCSTPLKVPTFSHRKSAHLERVKSSIKRRQLSRALQSSSTKVAQRLSLSLPTLTSSHCNLLACSSPVHDDVIHTSLPSPNTSADGQRSLFISGNIPTKVDHDVVLALSEVGLDPSKYPLVRRWADAVLSYPEAERQRWKTPRKSSSAPLDCSASVWQSSPLSRFTAPAHSRKPLPRISLSFSS